MAEHFNHFNHLPQLAKTFKNAFHQLKDTFQIIQKNQTKIDFSFITPQLKR